MDSNKPDLSTIEGVQIALTKLGYDPGAVDGEDGRKRAAVERFPSEHQPDAGPVDGVVSSPTSWRGGIATRDSGTLSSVLRFEIFCFGSSPRIVHEGASSGSVCRRDAAFCSMACPVAEEHSVQRFSPARWACRS